MDDRELALRLQTIEDNITRLLELHENGHTTQTDEVDLDALEQQLEPEPPQPTTTVRTNIKRADGQ